ncbi:MAG TPA: permease [Candidatus Krumholzibacteria bacterium]
MRERTKLALMVAVFAAAWFLPADSSRVHASASESLAMLHDYARQHVLLCLVPALFIAGAVSVFVRQAAVMKYLGARASKWLAYPVAAVSGTILAVCSCTLLPLFAGIYKRGAGLGPATAFLYSGPAINVLAIILTARVLGFELGVVRAVGAVTFAVVIGALMHLMFRREEQSRASATPLPSDLSAPDRRLWQDVVYFAGLVGILVFANWARPSMPDDTAWAAVFRAKWVISGALFVGVAVALNRWFARDELLEWVDATWGFAKQILPLLLGGVLVAGFLFGRPGHEALIPASWIAGLVGGNSLFANFFAAFAGAFMYFATLTEVPIVQGLAGAGMGKGPALALLLAGPALSLPSMLVIRSVLGTRKTVVYVTLVILLSTAAGWAYGSLAGSAF